MKSKNRKKVPAAKRPTIKRPNRKAQSPQRLHAQTTAGQTQKPDGHLQPETQQPEGRIPNHFPIVGIGASAGGLEALTELLKYLPPDTGVGVVFVQHLDPQHESALTQILTRATSMPVREVTDNLPVEANHVYVIPPNTTLGIAKGVLKLQPRQESRMPTRSIDFFFESLAEDQGKRAIGVILSGTATDGTQGLEAIKAEDGITFAQDESARYDSMPRSAVAAGCVDFVLKPEDIAKELARIAKHPYVASQPHEPISPTKDRDATEHEDDETPLPSRGRGSPRAGGKQARTEGEAARNQEGENGFKKILLLLRNHSGVDFSLYKSTTIQRRITRRMVLNKQNTLEEYALFLRGNAKELDALYSDVLIGVTSFFRNPEAFDVLKRKVFPKLLQQRGDDPLRVWVLGCSSGQEAYSIAMAFVESAENASRMRKFQVFATDLNDALLDKARHGLYAKSLAQDISPERLRRFFVEEEGGYRVSKPLRDMVVFARQNLISDPPFSRMDLISCRNLLIYIEPSLQKMAIPVFHYALKLGGCLFLGASESVGSFTELFEPLDKKHKIYCKKAVPTPAFQLPVKKERGEHPSSSQSRKGGTPLPMGKWQAEPEGFRRELNAQREADRVTVNQFAPPGVLINAELQILQFRGPTSAYLEPPTGKASFDVLKMARAGLMLPLRAAISRAKKENKTARKENVRINQNGKTRKVNVEVIPLKNLRERCFLIVFEDAEKARRAVPAPSREQPGGAERTPRPRKKEESRRIAELETELSETRDYLQSMQEQHQAANEELQASNEEVQSANEELQSLNEELETSKEELESANEELTTVNEEMANRNAELGRLNADLTNLQASTKLPIVLLGRDLTIRRFTAPAERIFNLLATDVGRPFSGVRHNLVVQRSAEAPRVPEATPFPLEDLVREVIDAVYEQEQEVCDKNGRWYSLRARPYMTVDNKVDGAVLVLVDINDLKRVERETKDARDYAQAIVRTARDPLLVLCADLRVNTANEAYYKTFKTTPEQTEGRLIFELSGGGWEIPKLRMFLEDMLPRKSFFDDFEVTHDFPRIGRRTMLLNARCLNHETGTSQLILLAIEDVTERQHLSEVTRKLAAIVQTSEDAIFAKTLEGIITSWNPGAERMYGYSAEEIVGKNVSVLIPPARAGESERLLEQLRRGEHIGNFETERVRKNGSTVPVSLSLAPLLDDRTGQLTAASLIARDITEHKQAAERLRVSEIRFRGLFEASHDGVLILDSVSRQIADANPYILDLLGYSRKELLGKELWQIGLLKDEQASHVAFRELQQRRLIRYEDLPLQTKSGEKREVEVVANLYEEEGKQVIQCNIRDITERKKAEEALRESEERLRHANTELGQRVAELQTANAEVQESRRAALNVMEDAIQSRQAMERLNVELRESEQRFRQLANAMPHIVWTAQPDGHIDYYNERWYEFSGFARDQFGQSSWQPILHPDDVQRSIDTYFGCVRAGKPYQIEYRFKDRFRGDYRWFMGQALPIRNEQGEIVKWFGTYTDIDDHKRSEEKLETTVAERTEELRQANTALLRDMEERKKLEEQLLQAQKMESIGVLAGGVAHDFNNILNIIQGYVFLLREHGAQNKQMDEGLTVIHDVIQRGAALVQQLLTLARKSSTKLEMLDANVVVEKLIALISQTFPKTIELSSDLEQNLPPIVADKNQLGQALLNLSLNARDAVINGGRIIFKTQSIDGARLRGLGGPTDERYLCIEVTDTGRGMDASVRKRIFEPFFTTKDKAQGTGLGLSVVYGIVKSHNGLINVESEPECGTSFRLYFPVAPSLETTPMDCIPEAGSETTQRSGGCGTILLVEDEKIMLDVLEKILLQQGYRVFTATDGETALDIYQRNKQTIDAVLLDIGLPKITGRDVLLKIRNENPEVKVVVASGYLEPELKSELDQAGVKYFLHKPYLPAQVVKTLERLIEREA